MNYFSIGSRTFASGFLLLVFILAPSQLTLSQYTCQRASVTTRTGSIASGDPTQTGRVFRDGIPSSCAGGVPTSGAVAGSYRYDQYSFTNPTGQNACVTVDLDATACGGTANNSTQINAYSPTFDPANPMTNLVGKPGFSTIGAGSLGFSIAAGASFVVVVHEVVAGGGCTSYSINVNYRTGCRQAGYDVTNDGKADPTYWTPATGVWNILSSGGGSTSAQFGVSTDILAPGDYTGDGVTDLGVYRPTNNTLYYGNNYSSPSTNFTATPWGVSGDVAVPNDYDKDGKTDVAVWRPSNGFWYVLRSSDSTVMGRQWGQNGDTPVTGDYDGDLAGDFAVVRNGASNRQWFILNSNYSYGFQYGCGTTSGVCGSPIVFGLNSDRLVTGDFDGDLRSDVSVYRPSDGTWYYLSSNSTAGNAPGGLGSFRFGISTDIPQPADYDGDKRTDFAVYRPSNGTWYWSNSANGTYATYSGAVWGGATDQPATSPYLETNP